MNAEEMVLEAGFTDVVLLQNFSYDSALIGVTSEDRAVYDFDKMVEWTVKNHGMSADEAAEWIEYNTIRALPYAGDRAPIIMYPLYTADNE